MKILITGSEGFVGKRLAQVLEEEGHTVFGFDIVNGDDILNADSVNEAIKDVDVVYHIAAQADLTKIKDPDTARACNDINILGTYNIAHACALNNVYLVYASTCCVYGNTKSAFGVDDEDTTVPQPRELYAASKLAGEQLVIGYSLSLGLPYTILRYGTIYGPGMREALAVHVFLDQAHQGKDITIHGDGKQERTQTYIEDIVIGSVAVLDTEEAKGQIINLCGKDKISVIGMANDILKLAQSPSKITHGPDRPWQTFYENVNLEKARRIINWEPKTSWEEGLKKTDTWFREKKGIQK